MIFENLADRLQASFRRLRSSGKLTEIDVAETMREVRMALLEADVNFSVVKDFVKRVKERAIGQNVLDTFTPAQAVIQIVNEELTELMGGTQSKLTFLPNEPTIIMMVGLQGAGKTTTAGKLALNLKKQGKKPLLVADDIYRPAAVEQLKTLAKEVGSDSFSMEAGTDAVTIAKNAAAYAKTHANDVVIIDTAGRLHVNEELMQELQDIKSAVQPQEILLVVDAMTGQDALNVAEHFHKDLNLSGLIMTKMDGDARGGAALSIKAVTGCPIKFVGMGEKLDALEPFYPDRMASRILGMGDMLSLIEKAQNLYDAKEAKILEEKFQKKTFSLDDFLKQLQTIRKMGSFEQILSLLPGASGIKKQLDQANVNVDFNGKEIKHIEAIIRSMTPKEREDVSILNGSRRKRIAKGSGTQVQEVNRLIKQFTDMQKMMKQMQGMGMNSAHAKKNKGKKKFGLPFFK